MLKYVFLCVFFVTFTVSGLTGHTTKFDLYYNSDNKKLECYQGEGYEYLKKGENIDIYVGLGNDGTISCIKQAWCYKDKKATASKVFENCYSGSTSLKITNITDTDRDGRWDCGFKVSANTTGKVAEIDVHCIVEYRLYNKVPVLNISGPNIRIRKTQENKDVTTYGLEYTYGKTGHYDINVTCGFDTNSENYNLELYAVKINNEHDQRTTKLNVSSVTRTFRLKQDLKKIICNATHNGDKSLQIRIMLFLYYIPQPSLRITEPNLKEEHYNEEIEGRRDYSLNFTDNSQASFQCRLEFNEHDYKVYYIYQKSVREKVPEKQENVKGGLLKSLGPIKLDKNYDKYITCLAENTQEDSILPKGLSSIIHLKYFPAPKLSITGSGLTAGPNDNVKVPVYTLKYTNDNKVISLLCSLENRTDYKLRFQIYAKNGRSYPLSGIPDIISDGVSRKVVVNNPTDIEYINCVANNTDKTSIFPKTLSSQVYLIYTPSAGKIKLNVKGITGNGQCKEDPGKTVNTICEYNFGAKELENNEIQLTCHFKGGTQLEYNLRFDEDATTIGSKKVKGGKKDSLTTTIRLTKSDKTVTCSVWDVDAVDGSTVCYKINLIYNPPPTTTPTTRNDWLYVTAGVVFILILLIIVGMLFFCRRKPQPNDSNYANVSGQQVNYQTKPVPAPRTLTKPNQKDQKPSVSTKPTTAKKKAVLESTYSEPKDSTDMSEALYADPNRFVGEPDTYAQPYVKSDTYAEPYVAGSDVTYAELYQDRDLYSTPDKSQKGEPRADLCATVGSKVPGKDLYATPVPKAQRKTVVKEDEYTNIFKGMYGNTKK